MTTKSPLTKVLINTRVKDQLKGRARRIPPFNVILENDDHHSFEFVVDVLSKALAYSSERSFQLTMQAHTSGRAVIWTGPKETAEFKADKIRTFHEKRSDASSFGPLICTIEPAPG